LTEKFPLDTVVEGLAYSIPDSLMKELLVETEPACPAARNGGSMSRKVVSRMCGAVWSWCSRH